MMMSWTCPELQTQQETVSSPLNNLSISEKISILIQLDARGILSSISFQIILHQRAAQTYARPSIAAVTLTLALTLKLDRDIDILKMYLLTKNKIARSSQSKVAY